MKRRACPQRCDMRRCCPVLVLLLCAAALVLGSFERGVCHPDCIKHGNCGENGRCMCPFGRLGEACEIDFLAPCRLGPGFPAICDFSYPMSCECLRRCREYSCPTNSSGARVCHWQVADDDQVGCFMRDSVHPDQQFSLVPDEKEAGIKYFAGSQAGAKQVDRRTALGSFGGVQQALPLSHCPARCNMRGQCSWVVGGKPYCTCFRGFSGHACQITENLCPLKCNGLGSCEDVFCHCRPPYFSIGCSRSKRFSLFHSQPNPTDFKIYMYELDSRLAYDLNLASGPEEEHIHMAHQKFIEQLLLSPVRTEDPSEASLFFVPALSWSYGGNDLNVQHLDLVVDHIATHYPYWNRSQGRDHFLWLTNDRGACGLTGLAEPAIKLTHFGLFTCNNSIGWSPGSILNKEYGCYHPLRDVVTPPYDFMARPQLAATAELTVDDIIAAKKTLFFFTGTVSRDPEYSGGTRQQLQKLSHHWNDPDILVEGEAGAGLGDYERSMREAKFCLAVYGYGFGMRLLTCMFTGSVPVIIQEHVTQPFEGILPYEAFSLRLRNADLPRLPQILRSVTQQQYRQLVEGVVRYRDAFHWDTAAGGRAFDYTVAALRRRYLNLQSLYF